MYCKRCKKETNNPKYCSRSCAASANNVKHPKRKPTHFCEECGIAVLPKHRWCEKCTRKCRTPLKDRPLGDIQYGAKYQVSAFIRQHARKTYRNSDRPRCCENCGYDKHYEVCHKKAINDFSKDVFVREINHLDNLIALCPNCHWELDHGLLEVAKIRKK